MVWITLNVHDLRDGILRLVAQRVNNDSTADGTIGASAAGLAGAGDFQASCLSVCGGEIEAQRGQTRASGHCALKKRPSRKFHDSDLHSVQTGTETTRRKIFRRGIAPNPNCESI